MRSSSREKMENGGNEANGREQSRAEEAALAGERERERERNVCIYEWRYSIVCASCVLLQT